MANLRGGAHAPPQKMAKKKRAAAKAEAEDDWVAAAEEAAAAAAAAAVEEAAADSEAEAPEESLEEEVEVAEAEAESEADDEAEGEDESEDEGAPSAPVDAYDNGKTKKVEPRFGLLFLVGLVVSGLRALLALVLDPFGRSARAKAAARRKRITAAARSGPMKKSEKIEYGAKKSKKSESYRKQGEYGAKKFIKP